MSKMTMDQAYNQNSKKQNEYFRLVNDGDSARIRFMYRSLSEIETYAVHVVEVNGRRYTVDCLKDADGQGDCPFCTAGVQRRIQTYFKVFNVDEGLPQIWTRGIKAAAFIENGLKMSRSKEICQDVYRVTRKGVAGDLKTQYPMTFESYDDTTLASLPPSVNLDESNTRFIIRATADDMKYYLTNGTLPGIEARQDANQQDVQPRTAQPRPQASEPMPRRPSNRF